MELLKNTQTEKECCYKYEGDVLEPLADRLMLVILSSGRGWSSLSSAGNNPPWTLRRSQARFTDKETRAGKANLPNARPVDVPHLDLSERQYEEVAEQGSEVWQTWILNHINFYTM